jgi:ABC-2 type transport system permease protein
MSPRRLWAFFWRDLLVGISYRTGLAFTAVGGVMTLTVFYFLARTVGASPALRGQGDYFSYALVGVAVASSLRSLQTSFASRLRETQSDGSLEVLLGAPLSTFQVVAGLAAYPIASALGRALALLAAGAWLFGAQLSISPVAFAAALLVSVVTFGALGLLSAAFVLVFKRGDPFSYALDAASYLLCGVIYPVDVLPPILQALARFLPATHALEALRAAGLHDAPLAEVLPSLARLGLFAAVLWPLAAVALAIARRHVERVGTLGQP